MTGEDDQHRPVLSYARPERWSAASRRVPVEPVAGEFMVGAWATALLVAPITLFFDRGPAPFCVLIGAAMLFSVMASGLVALAMAARWLVQRRRLELRGEGPVATIAGAVWMLGVLSISAVLVHVGDGSNAAMWSVLCWAIAQPIAASIFVVRRSDASEVN
jgi:hypothetical protein